MSTDFCANSGCPLNQVTLDERSDGLELIIGFVSSSHQPDYVFTPVQMSIICNEISCLIYKYKECREAMVALYGPDAPLDYHDFAIFNSQQPEYEAPIQKEPVVEPENLKTNKIASPPKNAVEPFPKCSFPVPSAPPLDDYRKPEEVVDKHRHKFDNNQKEFGRQTLDNVAQMKGVFQCKPAPMTVTRPYTTLDNVALIAQIKRITLQPKPDFDQPEYEEPEPVLEYQQPKLTPPIYDFENSQTRLHFSEIYKQTGFIGLRKKESLTKLSGLLNNPLGCCYDEIRKSWIIADSGNNRILLYPKGTGIESPKFVNPASVTVIRPGHTLGVLSDTSLCVYNFCSGKVSVVYERAGGSKIDCRGLATTPLGNIATIQRKRYGNFEVVIYDMFDAEKYGDVVSRTSFSAGSPSFCHMKGSRLVISDLGNQTLMMFEYDVYEKNAKISKTTPFKWNHIGEPNGAFDFVSGVQVDVDGWSLVADARGRTVQLFDQQLKFVCRVGCDFVQPYTSSIAINQKREVMFIERKAPAEVILATLESFDRLPPILGLPAHPRGYRCTPNTSTVRSPVGSSNTSFQSPTASSSSLPVKPIPARGIDDLVSKFGYPSTSFGAKKF